MNLQDALAAIDWTVVEELKHIPSGAVSSPQQMLRQEYAAFRSVHRELTDQLRPRDGLVQAIANVKRTHSGFVPRYDGVFFFSDSAIAATLAEDELAMEIHAIARNGGSETCVRDIGIIENGQEVGAAKRRRGNDGAGWVSEATHQLSE